MVRKSVGAYFTALTFAVVASATSAERQVWGFVKSGEEVLLFYGIPESDAVTISFICNAKPRRFEIVSTVLPPKPGKGRSARLSLSNGAVTAGYDGKLDGNAEDGLHFEASMAAAPKILDVLKSGKSLTISFPGKQERVPLRGIAKPLGQFEAACFR